MNTDQILKELSLEIVRLQDARAVLASIEEVGSMIRRPVPTTKAMSAKRGRPPGKESAPTVVAKPAKRSLSEEARARIAAAQQRRWAKVKKAAKAAARTTSAPKTTKEVLKDKPKTTKKVLNDKQDPRVAAKPVTKRALKVKHAVKTVRPKQSVAPQKKHPAKTVKPRPELEPIQESPSEAGS